MVPGRSLRVVAIALVGAMGSAFVMQQLASEPPPDAAAQMSEPMRPGDAQGDDLVSGALVAQPRLPDTAPAGPAIDLQRVSLDLVAPEADPDAPALRFDTDGGIARHNDGDSCAPALSLSPGLAATVELSLTASCHAGAVVRIAHGALAFAERVDTDGTLTLSIPALSENARVTLQFPDGKTLDAAARVPDAAEHTRTALVWKGGEGFALHAYHDAATHGDAGHRHADAPVDTSTPGAFVVSLGDPTIDDVAARAEVHSLPRHAAQTVRFAIEARQTSDTCGREQTAQVVIGTGDAAPRVEDLSVRMEECDATRGAFALIPLPQIVQMAAAD